jgi:signal transduction histidine kinase
LWLWLALGLLAIAGLPTLVTVQLSHQVAAAKGQADQAQVAAVRRILGTDATRWRDPSWQRQAAQDLAALGVDVGLVVKGQGQGGLVFATGGGRRWMSAAGLAPGAPGPTKAAVAGTSPLLTFREIAVPGQGGARPVMAVADLWLLRPPAALPPPWLPEAGGLIALLATLAVVAGGLVRLVLRPLAAMEQAARQIAGGTLEVRVPSSAAREVAAVAAALGTMSAGLREATERQATLEHERRLFIGAIAHDLRTPLFTLSSYLAGLQEGLATTPEKAGHYVAVCREEAAGLERLVAGLFAYSRLEYLEQEPQRAPLELGDVLRSVAADLEQRALAARVALTVAGAPAPCVVHGDPQLLARAVENLLENALRYTPPGGQVVVDWGPRAGDAFFTVADTGPGFAADDLPHIFSPLYRGDAARRQTGGRGLGLAIARRILQAHGGDLSAANGAKGGAVFTALLPVVTALAPPAPPGRAATPHT